MSTRELILARVRRNQPAPRALPAPPAAARSSVPATDLWPRFAAALERMGGQVAAVPAGVDLDTLVRQRFPAADAIVSATPRVKGSRALPPAAAPGTLADVDVGVVQAAFGVAETGSVWLSEREFGVNALGFLPQHLVVLLDLATLLPDLHAAYRHPAFATARYAALMTGPSATADIEGVLIRGAQGIRSLTVVPLSA